MRDTQDLAVDGEYDYKNRWREFMSGEEALAQSQVLLVITPALTWVQRGI